MSEFGDNFSSGLNDTFGDGFSDKLGGVVGNVTSQVAGDYVSKKVGGPFGDMLGGAVGSTLGNTVSGAFSSSESATQPKAADTNTFGGINDGMNAQKASLPKSAPKIALNPKAGQTHVGAAQQNRNVKILNKQRDVAAQQSTIQKKAPLTLNQKIEATAKKMNATRIAEQKAKMPASQQAIYSDLVAKAKAGRQKVLAQQGTPQVPKLLGTDSPPRSAEVPASQARTATPAYKISDEDDAAIGREADGIVKTKNLEGPLKYHKDAYATGTPKAKAEFENFLGKVHDKDPGKAQDIITNMRKSGFDVGGSSTNEVTISGVPEGAIDNGDSTRSATEKAADVGENPKVTMKTTANEEETVQSINMEKDRIDNILSDEVAKFDISDNPEADSSSPWYESVSAGQDAVLSHTQFIEKEAKSQGVDPDLVKAIMFSENARGSYFGAAKIAEGTGVADTYFPMNINPNTWGELGLNHDNASNPESNISASITLIKRISDRIDNPSVEKIASIWNFTGRENVNDFGAYVGRMYQEKPWGQNAQE